MQSIRMQLAAATFISNRPSQLPYLYVPLIYRSPLCSCADQSHVKRLAETCQREAIDFRLSVFLLSAEFLVWKLLQPSRTESFNACGYQLDVQTASTGSRFTCRKNIFPALHSDFPLFLHNFNVKIVILKNDQVCIIST